MFPKHCTYAAQLGGVAQLGGTLSSSVMSLSDSVFTKSLTKTPLVIIGLGSSKPLKTFGHTKPNHYLGEN
jgi:hypothetical protein